MKKIISLFERDYSPGTNNQVVNRVIPGAEWIQQGEGVATQKLDGTCCLMRGGVLYKRYEVKPGRTPPAGFEPACPVDSVTGKQQGWMKVDTDNPSDKWHVEAYKEFHDHHRGYLPNGTYELCGPKIQGNPEGLEKHTLMGHAHAPTFQDCPTDFVYLKEWLKTQDIEGIVWHHPDGRMVKIKKKDFGLRRKPE